MEITFSFITMHRDGHFGFGSGHNLWEIASGCVWLRANEWCIASIFSTFVQLRPTYGTFGWRKKNLLFALIILCHKSYWPVHELGAYPWSAKTEQLTVLFDASTAQYDSETQTKSSRNKGITRAKTFVIEHRVQISIDEYVFKKNVIFFTLCMHT